MRVLSGVFVSATVRLPVCLAVLCCTAWLVRFLTPQGSDSLAQGNALGTRSTGFARLKAWDSSAYRSPSARVPRALPWAKLSQPFGLKTQIRASRHNTARGGQSKSVFSTFFLSLSVFVRGVIFLSFCSGSVVGVTGGGALSNHP